MVGLTRTRLAGLAVFVFAGTASLLGLAPGRGAQPVVTPPEFATVTSPPGSGPTVELRSVANGGVVGRIGQLGPAWTGNGFAFSPDERYVYFTLIPKSSIGKGLLLEQLSVATHRRRFIARGEQPSVSPDGGLLAYVTGADRSAAVVVRDMATGRRRSVDVAHLLEGESDMLNASLAWVGDGSKLAVFESCCAVAARATSAQTPPRGSSDPSSGSDLHLIVVSVPRHGSLSARRVALPGATSMPVTIGTDASRPDSLLVSWLSEADRAAVDRLTLGASRATLRRVLAIPHSLVVASEPSGRHLLYLVGHSRPDLWTATVDNHRLTQPRLLVRNPPIDDYAW